MPHAVACIHGVRSTSGVATCAECTYLEPVSWQGGSAKPDTQVPGAKRWATSTARYLAMGSMHIRLGFEEPYAMSSTSQKAHHEHQMGAFFVGYRRAV